MSWLRISGHDNIGKAVA